MTTRSQVSVYRTNDHMETIAAIDRNMTKMAIIPIYGKKNPTTLLVTVLVDSQVSDRCPWATCYNMPGLRYVNHCYWWAIVNDDRSDI